MEEVHVMVLRLAVKYVRISANVLKHSINSYSYLVLNIIGLTKFVILNLVKNFIHLIIFFVFLNTDFNNFNNQFIYRE
jgi:hypothetical protein